MSFSFSSSSSSSSSFVFSLRLVLLLRRHRRLRLPLRFHLSSVNTSLFSRISPLAGPSMVGRLFSLRIIHFLQKFDPRLVKKGSRPVAPLIRQGILDILKQARWQRESHSKAAPTYSPGQSVHSQVVHFCRFGTTFFPKKVDILECPSRMLGGTTVFVGEKCTF